MTYPSTTFILARRALEMPAGRECVNWAVGMLLAGHEGEAVAMLASESPPFNAFEVADLRDRALAEVGATDLSDSEAVRAYAAERLIDVPGDESDLLKELRDLKNLCVAHDYLPALYDFYLLFFALDDLIRCGEQHYWPGATRKNFPEMVREAVDRLGD